MPDVKKFNKVRNLLKKELDIIEKGEEQKTHGLRPADYKVTCVACGEQVRKAFTLTDLKKERFLCIQCYLKELEKKKHRK